MQRDITVLTHSHMKKWILPYSKGSNPVALKDQWVANADFTTINVHLTSTNARFTNHNQALISTDIFFKTWPRQIVIKLATSKNCYDDYDLNWFNHSTTIKYQQTIVTGGLWVNLRHCQILPMEINNNLSV